MIVHSTTLYHTLDGRQINLVILRICRLIYVCAIQMLPKKINVILSDITPLNTHYIYFSYNYDTNVLESMTA